MINEFIRNILRFIILIVVQALILKNIELGKFINPFLYVLFVIVLPFETPKWLLLLSAFFLGISIDFFYDTGGIHASATVFMAYMRPTILKLFSPREGYELGTEPTVHYLGVPWFLSYAGILILMHHLLLFYFEMFRFSEFFSTFLRVITNSIFTLLLVIVCQYLFKRKNSSE